MNCLSCLRGKISGGKNSEGKKSDEKSDGANSDNKEDEELLPVAQPKENPISKKPSEKNEDNIEQNGDIVDGGVGVVVAPSSTTFQFKELASATNNFKKECLLGESVFGKFYKGTLDDGKVVAVKQLNIDGTKENKKFIDEVIKLSDLHHQNLVELIGYCVDGDHRLLVYEYVSMGSIKDYLHDLRPGKKPLDWLTRMKVAAGAAKAIEYLHMKVNPPVICLNIKSSNVLLDKNFKPKVGDYGLVNLESSSSSNMHQRMMGTVGVAPEYEYTGELTLKSDVYSFGVMLLELISGRQALDPSLPTEEQNIVSWAQPYIKDPKRFQEMADPIFKGVIPEKILNQAVGVAAMCLEEVSGVRPMISDILGDLNLLKVAPPEGFLESSSESTLPSGAVPKEYASSSSSSSSSSDSEHELDFKIEPFNRPEPQLQPQPESAHESEHEHEWESDPETEPEPELDPEPDLDTNSDSDSDTESEPDPGQVLEQVVEPEESNSHKDIYDSDSDSDSDSKSDPEPEPIQSSNLEQVVEPEDSTSSDSDSESESEPTQISRPEASTSHKDDPDSDHDSNSTSGSIYDEDAYSEEEFSDDDKPSTAILINSRSKARMKTKPSKKKVMFKTEETDSINLNMQRVNSSYNKKSFKKSKDDDQSSRNSNNVPIKRKNTSRMRKSNSRKDDNSDIEFTDGSDDEFGPQRFKSTISRFTAESRCYGAYEDESVRSSSSGSEK